MKILVLGGTGMLGHKLVQVLAASHDVTTTIRVHSDFLYRHPLALAETWLFDSYLDSHDVSDLLRNIRPDVVVNAIGSIRQGDKYRLEHALVNAALPQIMAAATAEQKIRFITFSTDCVFDGGQGPYPESHPISPTDSYALSKSLGEIQDRPHALTIRTSIIGPELRGKTSFFEWVLKSKGCTVSGYSNALYTGVPTLELAKIVRMLIENHSGISGIRHVASDPVSKADLIRLIDREFDLGITVNDNPVPVSDRRLDAAKLESEIGYRHPAWEDMLHSVHQDYDTNRSLYAADTLSPA